MDYTVLDAHGEIFRQLVAAPYALDDQGTKSYPEIVLANVPDGGQLLEGDPPFLGWYDGTWHERPAQPQSFTTWDPVAKAWVDERSVDDAKLDQWTTIQAARDAAIFGSLVWSGSTFQADATSQQRIQGAVLLAQLAKAANQPYSVGWTLADNTVRTLSADDVISLGLALGAMVQGTYAKGQALRVALDAATTIDQVQAIVWS